MATINEYSRPLQSVQEQYIPLPLDLIFQAGESIQKRADVNTAINDQFQTGLASMEALAPAHKSYLSNYVNQYKTEQSALLDRYKNNESDPNYIRESRKINMRFAADPNLKIIQEANTNYKTKQQLAMQLQANGKKYLDSNPTFTGRDVNGNLISNVGSVRATDFDDNIYKTFQNISNNLEDVGGGLKTNERNIRRYQQQLLNGAGSNQDIQDGINYYMQQGYTQKQALATINGLISSGSNFIRSDKDHFAEQMAWEKYKFNAQQQAANAPGMPNQFPFLYERSPIIESNLKDGKLSAIEKVLSSVNEKGNLKKGQFTAEDTPENRKKYGANAKPTTRVIAGSGMGYGGSSYDMLVVNGDYNKDHVALVNEAKEILGDQAKRNGKFYSDKIILSKYKDMLANQDMAYNFIKPNNEDYVKSIEALKIGKSGANIGGNFSILKDGKIQRGKEDVLKDIKTDSYSLAGINPSAFGEYKNGVIAINAVDKNNNAVQIIKPLNPNEQRAFQVPNKITELQQSNYSNEQLAKMPIQVSPTEAIIVQKDGSSGQLGVRAFLVNDKGQQQEVNINKLMDGAVSNFFNNQRPYENLK